MNRRNFLLSPIAIALPTIASGALKSDTESRRQFYSAALQTGWIRRNLPKAPDGFEYVYFSNGNIYLVRPDPSVPFKPVLIARRSEQ